MNPYFYASGEYFHNYQCITYLQRIEDLKKKKNRRSIGKVLIYFLNQRDLTLCASEFWLFFSVGQILVSLEMPKVIQLL